MAVVGTAYVVVRAITRGLNRDIESTIKKELKDTDQKVIAPEGEKLGLSLGQRIRRGLSRSGKGFDAEGKRIGSRFGRFFEREADGNGRGRNFARTFSQSLAKGISKTHIPGPTWAKVLLLGLGPVLKTITAYIGGAISLAGKLGSELSGGAGIGGAGLAALAQGLFVLKLAFSKAGSQTAAFKKQVKAFKEPIVDIVQRQLFPRLNKAMGILTKSLLPILNKQLGQTAKILGQTAIGFAQLTRDPFFRGNLQAVMSNNNKILGNLSKALQHVADVLLTVLRAAGPEAIRFSNFIANAAARLDAFTRGNQQRLAAFFKKSGDGLAELGKIFRNFGIGLFNVFKAANPAGQTFLDHILVISRKFREFTQSVGGKNKLRQFFSDAQVIVSTVDRLIGHIFAVLARGVTRNSGAGLVAVINAINDQLIPAFENLGKVLQQQGLGLQIAQLVDSFSKFLTVAAQTGALGAFTKTLDLILQAVTKILSIPGLGQLAAFALTLAGIGKAISLVFGKRALGLLIDGLLSGLRLLIGFLVANPIVAAIIGIIGVLVLLYTKVKWFHDGVNRVVGAVVDFAKRVGSLVATGFSKFMDFVKGLPQFFSNVWNDVYNAVAPIVSKIVDFVTTTWGRITDVISTLFGVWESIVSTGWGIIYGIFSRALIVLAIPFRILEGVVILIFEGLWKAITFIWNTGFNLISTIVRAIFTVISTIFGKIVGVVTTIFAAVWNAIRTPVLTIASFLLGVWTGIVNVARTVIGGLVHVVTTIFGHVASAIHTAFNGIASFVAGIWHAIGAGASAVVGVVTTIINGAIDIIDLFIGGLNDVINLANKLPGVDLPTISEISHIGAPAANAGTTSKRGAGRGRRVNNFAEGGVAKATPGGIMARIAEAKHDERIEPLDSDGLSKRDKALIKELVGSRRGFNFDVKTERTWTAEEAWTLVGRAEAIYGGPT